MRPGLDVEKLSPETRFVLHLHEGSLFRELPRGSETANALEAVAAKALDAAPLPTGGALVPQAFAAGMVGLLRKG